MLDCSSRSDQLVTGVNLTHAQEKVAAVSEIGASKAKTHLSRLLQRVEAGERFVITKHSRPVAELIPFRPHDADGVRFAIADLNAFLKTHSLGGLSVRHLVREARRY